MKKKRKFGVWFILLKDIATSVGIHPKGSIVKCNRHAHEHGACSFHTQDGLYMYINKPSDYINYNTAIPLDHNGWFADWTSPTHEEIDMLVMLHPQIDKGFLEEYLKTR